MKCQHCENREADNHFQVNWLGSTHHIHLCDECKEKLTKYYRNMIDQQIDNSEPAQTRVLGECTFPAEAEVQLRDKRRLNVLRERMNAAVELEEYETAARLRDEISHMEECLSEKEKEVLVP